MLQKSEIERLLLRARLLIQEGREDQALEGLERIQTNDLEQQREIAYLRAWCYNHQEEWDEAIHLLSPLYSPGSIEDDWHQTTHNERERRAFYLLLLGNAAVNLSHYEDAARHYEQCLKVLSLRRVHLPKVRLKARYALGLTCTMNGFFLAALQHYEEALRLCKNDPGSEDLPHIYYGLCDIHRLLGNFPEAHTYGKMALQLYQERSDRVLEGRMHNLLGRVCFHLGEYRVAADYYMEALSIATIENTPGMKMVNFVALADLRLAEERLEEAKRYCQRAIEVSEQVKDEQLCGMMYLVCGKVAYAEAKHATSEERYQFLEEAVNWYKKGKAHLARTQASTIIAELDGRLAQVLEELGQDQAAIAYWKSAYASLTQRKGLDWH